MQAKQQKAVMHEKDTDTHQRNNHQHRAGQMRFHPIHGKQRAALVHAG
jgi:hypothetical protein